MAPQEAATRTARAGTEANRARRARKSAQLIFRIAPDLKELVEEAAAITGRSVTDFVTEAARERAMRVVRESQDVAVWKLTREDARAFAEAISGPPSPNPRLEAAYAKYRRMRDLQRRDAAGADEPVS